MTDFAALKESLGGLVKTVFFCGADSSAAGPILYVADSKAKAQINHLLRTKTAGHPAFAKISVKTTKSLGLEKTKSLEEILSRVPHQHIMFDPSATIERANVLVCIAKQAREKLGTILKGCYFNSERRNIHFLFQTTATQQEIDLAIMRELIEPILLNNTKRLSKPFSCGITLSFHYPQGGVIAIDKASVVKKKVSGMITHMLKKLRLPLLVASASSLGVAAAQTTHNNAMNQPAPAAQSTAAPASTPVGTPHHLKRHHRHHRHVMHEAPTAVVAAPAPAADVSMYAPGPDMQGLSAPCLPAVSNVNGWLGGSGGGFHNSAAGGGIGLGEGGLAFPIGHSFGGQIDAFDGAVAHNNLQVLDGFLFWRDPAEGMIALHDRYEESNHSYVDLYGLRGDAFIKNWTATLEGGGVHTNLDGGTYYGEALVHWYTNPDWRLDAGYLRLKTSNAFQIGTEYQFGLAALPGLSIFADAGIGNHDLRYGLVGLRYYFSDTTKSLERRQREDMVIPSLDVITFSESHNIMAPRFHS